MSLMKMGEKNHNYGKHVNVGENNGMWKDDIGCYALHEWVRNRLHKPTSCQMCENLPRDLVSISGKCIRDITDWQWLCRKCHMRVKVVEYGVNNTSS